MTSVTKLIEILNKPFLIQWANNIGLEGIKLKDYKKQVQKEGNDNHLNVENYILKGIEFEGFEKLKQTLEGYEILGTEIDLSNGCINGRLDLALRKDGKIYVLDFKRNKNIYLSTKLQLSTYKYLYGADYIAYVNFEDFDIKILDIDTDKYFNIVKRLYQINLTLTELNEKL